MVISIPARSFEYPILSENEKRASFKVHDAWLLDITICTSPGETYLNDIFEEDFI